MQLLLKLESTPELNKCLDPQPSAFSDCIEDYENSGVFNFFEGTEMDGHRCIMTVQAPNLNVEPQLDWDRCIWFWRAVSENTINRRNWWAKYKQG